jgi:hypothetical protein
MDIANWWRNPMRTHLITGAAVLLLSVTAATAQTARPAARPDDENASRGTQTFTPALVGSWKSAAEQLKLTSDFDKSVWGNDASSVRTVELAVRASGEATLKVTKKVVDARGRTVPASTWIEEVQLRIGAPHEGVATRIEHDAQVVDAVRLFPDDPTYKWSIDGLRVKVVSFTDGDGSTIEIRYDTPEGRGSFWETLRRDRSVGPRRASR